MNYTYHHNKSTLPHSLITILLLVLMSFSSTLYAKALTGTPIITSPSSGSTLSGSSQVFALDDLGMTLDNWYLRIGTSLGGNDLANRFAAGSSSSITINNLPTDSSTLYVRLMYKETGTWNIAGNYNYTAYSQANPPIITSPVSGSSLAGSSQTFNLDNKGINIDNWYLRIGTSLGNNNIANRFAAGSSSSITINNLPTDGSTIYVRLKYKESGIWRTAGDYNYTAHPPIINSPVSGSTLGGSSQLFSLDNQGTPIDNWHLRVGTSLGANDIASRFAAGASNSITINNLPTDNSLVYVRLMYKTAGIWNIAGDYNYTAYSPAIPPTISNPPSGSTFAGSSQVFSLDNQGNSIDNWHLRVGTSLGANDLASRFAAGSSNSITINNLPTDSSTIYVRLMFKVAGTWNTAADYNYTAATSIDYSELGPYQTLRYPENGLTNNNYVVYYPENAITADMPVVVFLEGGGSATHIDDYQGAMEFMASQGYFVIGAESGQSYNSDYARSIVQSAIDTAINAHGLTISKLAVMGHSQGGGQAFYVMQYFQDPAHGGYGSDVSLVISIDGWFSFTMNGADLAALQGDIAFIQMNDLIGTGTDPRIHLSIWNLANNTEKSFLTLSHNNHGYIKGNLNTLLNERQDILYQLGALTYDAFNHENNGYTSIPNAQKTSFDEVFNALLTEDQYSSDCEGVAYNARQNQLRFFNIDYCAMAQ